MNVAVLSRITSAGFQVRKSKIPGLSHDDLLRTPYESLELPAFLEALVQSLLIEKMSKSSNKILSLLKKKTMSRKPRHRYAIYLTMSVLLYNLEFVYNDQALELKRYSTNAIRPGIWLPCLTNF